MSGVLFILIFILIKVVNLYETDEDIVVINNIETIKPNISKTILINYEKETNLGLIVLELMSYK